MGVEKRLGTPVVLDKVTEIHPKRDRNGEIIPNQAGFGWKISEEAKRYIAQIEENLRRS